MSIAEQMDRELKDAMRARQSAKVACIRQIRSKVQEAVNAPGFQGTSDDALQQKVIASYIKALEKSMVEMRQGGERAEKIIAGYQAEIDYLKPFLPKLLGALETETLVRNAIEQTKAEGKAHVGKVLGWLMKSYRTQLDAALAKRIAERLLDTSSADQGL